MLVRVRVTYIGDVSGFTFLALMAKREKPFRGSASETLISISALIFNWSARLLQLAEENAKDRWRPRGGNKHRSVWSGSTMSQSGLNP